MFQYLSSSNASPKRMFSLKVAFRIQACCGTYAKDPCDWSLKMFVNGIFISRLSFNVKKKKTTDINYIGESKENWALLHILLVSECLVDVRCLHFVIIYGFGILEVMSGVLC